MMELALRTTVVLGLAFLIAGGLRRATPATRHLLWHVTIAIIVLAPVLQTLTPRIPLPAWLALDGRRAPLSGVLEPHRQADALSTSAVSASQPADQPTIGVGSTCTDGLLSCLSPTVIWFSGSLLVGAWFALGWLASAWIAWRAAPAPVTLEREMREVCRDLGRPNPKGRPLRRRRATPTVRLMTSSRGPLTAGIFRPVILLPAIAMTWDADRRRAILAHELAHVRRADTRTQALAHIACALYWFNPLVWMAARALRRERERACDDEVVALGILPSTYAQDLLDIARALSARFSPSAAIAMARRSELEGRLLSILAPNRRRTPTRISRWALPAAMCGAAVVALGGQPGAAQMPQIRPPMATGNPPAPSLFYDSERHADARQRAQDDSSTDTLWRSQDQDARERAVLSLALSGNTAAIGPLIHALDDPSGQVREKAAIGLAVRSSPEVIEPLIRALQDTDAQVREKAAAGLMLRRDPRAIDALLIAIADADGQVREKAAIALGTSGDRRAVAALERATRDLDAQVREKAVAGLALLGVVR